MRYRAKIRVVCRGGPFDCTHWRYPHPLPNSLMLFDADTLSYHEYRHETNGVYHYVGFVGVLPIPADLDSPPERSSM